MEARAAALRVFCVLSHIAVTELWNSGSGLESQTGVVLNEGLALASSSIGERPRRISADHDMNIAIFDAQ